MFLQDHSKYTFICVIFIISSIYQVWCKTMILQCVVFSCLPVATVLVVLAFHSLLLCDEMIDDMLLMQLQPTFTVLLSKILCSLLDLEKCCFDNFRNILPILVLTLRGKVRLNQIILCFYCLLLILLLTFVFGVKTKGSLNPFFSMLQNILLLPFEKPHRQMTGQIVFLLIELGNSLKIVF